MDVDGNEGGDAVASPSDSLIEEDENDKDSNIDEEGLEEEEDGSSGNESDDGERGGAGGGGGIVDDDDLENVGGDHCRGSNLDDFWSHIPSEQDKIEMKRSLRRPSEWLKLLCKDWVQHGSASVADDSQNEGTRQGSNNRQLAEAADAKLVEYKPYLKDGKISPHLLCILCQKQQESSPPSMHSHFDFFNVLNITDNFDKAYVLSQVERFESMYNILNLTGRKNDKNRITDNQPSTMERFRQRKRHSMSSSQLFDGDDDDDVSTKNANSISFQEDPKRPRRSNKFMKTERRRGRHAGPLKKQLRTRVQREQEKQMLTKQEENRIRKEIELENLRVQQAVQKQLAVQQREEKSQLKIIAKRQRELSQQEQKQAALQHAAELVESNRVPIELTGIVKTSFPSSMDSTSKLQDSQQHQRRQRPRSKIMVSTASDLHQIVTHANNLHAKYKAIADAHGTTVSWSTIAREIGIGVKVREKYSRMYKRAIERNFDFSLHGHWKLRDHPEIFTEPCPVTGQTNGNNNSRKKAAETQPRPQTSSLNTETTSTAAHSQDSTMATAMMMLTSTSPNLTSLQHPELRIDGSAALDDPLSAPSSPSRVPFHDDGDFFPPSAAFASQEDISDAREASARAADSSTFPPSLPPSPVVENTGEVDANDDGGDDENDSS